MHFIYTLVPRLWERDEHSGKLADRFDCKLAAQREHQPRGGSRSSRSLCQRLCDQDSPELRGVSRVGWMQCWAAFFFVFSEVSASTTGEFEVSLLHFRAYPGLRQGIQSSQDAGYHV